MRLTIPPVGGGPSLEKLDFPAFRSNMRLTEHNVADEVRNCDPPLVTVLVVTWNRREEVMETVRSINDQAYRNVEIVVVDNGSTDGTESALQEAFPEVKLVALDSNRGISSGRNAGIDVAMGEIVLCLDSDASLAPDTLGNIVRRFEAEADLGIINSKVVNAHSKVLDGGPGWVYTERQKARQDEEFLSWSFSETGVAIRKEVFERAGTFLDLLFFGCEGLEFSLRTWDAGYKILYYPEALVYHRVALRSRIAGKERDCLFLKNTLYTYIVRYPLWVMLPLGALKVGATLVRGARRRYLTDILRVLIDVASRLAMLLELRDPIRNQTARFHLRLQRQHGPLSWDLLSWLKYKT